MSYAIKFAKVGGPGSPQNTNSRSWPHEVRIKVKAIGINRGEAMCRNDRFVKNDCIEPIKFPAGLGYEAAGIVDPVGKDVAAVASRLRP